MRKIIYILTALSMLFILSGCGSESSSKEVYPTEDVSDTNEATGNSEDSNTTDATDNNETVNDNNGTEVPVVKTIQMDFNTTYEVYSGDSLTTDEESEIIVDHEYGSEFKTVTLLSGSAILTSHN